MPPQQKLCVQGVEIHFPHVPYKCQETYMSKVIQSLQKGSNALLESPTGTGKTLCLLCASLAWLMQYKAIRQQHAMHTAGMGVEPDYMPPRRIIYASRTHSQLAQVIKELKSTVYAQQVTMAVLGSREQLCIHPKVAQQKGSVQNAMCRSLTKDRKCMFFNGVQKRRRDDACLEQSGRVHDIEDLVSLGRQEIFCPFFLERDAQLTADIVFVPYNYLVDPDIRKTLQLNLKHNIVIIDEAHNIAGMMTSVASFDISSTHLANCIGEVKRAIELLSGERGAEEVQITAQERAQQGNDFLTLQKLLQKLEENIKNAPLREVGGKQVLVQAGDWLLTFLAEINLTQQTYLPFLDVCSKVITTLSEESDRAGMPQREPALQTTQEYLRMMFNESVEDMRNSFKALIQLDLDASPPKGRRQQIQVSSNEGRTLSLWCMDPSISVSRLMRSAPPYLFVLTSGTLSPITAFAAELELDFPIMLENPHVIAPSQVSALVAPRGPRAIQLNASYQSRDLPEYKSELGIVIVNLCRIVPAGLLVFFPSYSVLTNCLDWWKRPAAPGAKSTWESICAHKTPVLEPRESAKLKEVFAEFGEALRGGGGAVFFAVCRGKVSEGLDFADAAGRAVVIVGLPYPNKADLRVKLKREYLDERAHRTRIRFNGGDWYSQQATRAVNQCVGRIIRHSNDYGAVVFCDARFGQTEHINALSCWLRPQVQVASTFGDITRTLSQFFRTNHERALAPPPCSPAPHRPTSAADAAAEARVMAAAVSSTARIGDQARGFWRDSMSAPDLVAQLGVTPAQAPALPPTPAPKEAAPRNDAVTRAVPSPSGPPPEPVPPSGTPTSPVTPANVSQASSAPAARLQNSKEDAKQYLLQVKEQLSSAEYGQFKAILQKFKVANAEVDTTSQAEAHFEALVGQCIGLFGARRALLEGFSTFTPPRFRERYLRMIRASFAGAAPGVGGYATKRPREPAPGSDGCGRVLAPAPEVDLVTGKAKKQKAAAPAFANPLPGVGADPQGPVAANGEPSRSLLPGAAPQRPTSSASGDSTQPAAPAGFECQICKDQCRDPHSARCGHICCHECWTTWLAQKCECPVCRAKVRMKLLTKLHV